MWILHERSTALGYASALSILGLTLPSKRRRLKSIAYQGKSYHICLSFGPFSHVLSQARTRDLDPIQLIDLDLKVR
jgi:hypothetical protein